MHERVVDRAAVYATPARLAIRDRLLVALAFASGIYEVICFLSFGKVFTAFQTGNIVFLGVGLTGTRPPAGPDPVSVVISLLAFGLGAALAVRILKPFDGDEESRTRTSPMSGLAACRSRSWPCWSYRSASSRYG
jgi:uncharacterized membrane protein YoaK (UPF0700 family)